MGADLWDSRTVAGTSWYVLPDPGFRFYADPFPFWHQGRAFVFVEDLDHRTNKACDLGRAVWTTRARSGRREPVLEEPWHLSYPFVFEHAGEIWMIPESSADRTVRALPRRSLPAPLGRRRPILLAGIAASDATVVQHDGPFWMFAPTRDGAGSWSDTLSLFHAPRLHGPWQPHAANPVLVDQGCARPAGAMVVRDGKLWRPVQDCAAGYGRGIGLAEITRLDHEGFAQKQHAVLQARSGWPGRRLHTLNRAGRLECIDGPALFAAQPHARRAASKPGRAGAH